MGTFWNAENVEWGPPQNGCHGASRTVAGDPKPKAVKPGVSDWVLPADTQCPLGSSEALPLSIEVEESQY